MSHYSRCIYCGADDGVDVDQGKCTECGEPDKTIDEQRARISALEATISEQAATLQGKDDARTELEAQLREMTEQKEGYRLDAEFFKNEYNDINQNIGPELAKQKARAERFESAYAAEHRAHSEVLGILGEYFPSGADIRASLNALKARAESAESALAAAREHNCFNNDEVAERLTEVEGRANDLARELAAARDILLVR